jgi:hypothetical protein
VANQAIALQSRAPQTDFMGRAIQQNAQMMNMMSQQRAAQRQAAQAAQAMQMEQAKEARAVAGEERAVAKFALDQDALLYAKYRNMAPAVIESNSPEVYRAWLDALVKESPERGAMLAQAMPVERFDAAALARMMATMDERFAAQYGKAITRELIDPDTGGVSAANISSIPGASFSQPVPDISRPRAGAAAAQTPTSAFPTTAAPATDAQIDEAARKILRGAGVGELGIGAEDFDRASARANELSAGGGARMQPISMTTGPQMGAQPDLTAVVQDMMSSGQISQANLQLMREMAGPDKDAQLAQILKANNIQIVPDAQPQMRSAVLRPGEDAAPQMQQVQFNPNAFEQARAKPTGQSPLPGSSQVPIPRIREEAAARAPTPEQIYAAEMARETARRDAAEGRPKPLTPEQEAKLRRDITMDYKMAQSTIDMMLDPTTGVVAAARRVRALSPSQKEAITGLSGYAPSLLPSSRQADTRMGNLIGKVTQLGKKAAALDGAIGPMAVQEWAIVRKMIAQMDLTKMEVSDLDDQMDIIEAQALRAAEVTRRAYEDQYAEEFQRYGNRFRLTDPPPRQKTQTSTETRLPRVRSDADFNRLAPGTLFIDPNGKTRRKP